jgi:peptidoglycan hydrolase-like protein with peptidoglycan-binding domain
MDFARPIAFSFPLCRGEDVRGIQQALTILQSHPPCGTVDGIYGKATSKSVEAFQSANALPATGVVDRATWDELFALAAKRQEDLPEGARSSLVTAAAKNAQQAPASV